MKFTSENLLDQMATEILAKDRKDSGITSHEAIRETGIMSESQYERRTSREVYSFDGHLDALSSSHRMAIDQIQREGMYGKRTTREYSHNTRKGKAL